MLALQFLPPPPVIVQESSVVRRLGLMLVGRTLEPASLLPAKIAFHAVDADGKGYIVEEDFAKVRRARYA